MMRVMTDAIARAEALIVEDPSAAVEAAAVALAGARTDGDRATIAWALAVRAQLRD